MARLTSDELEKMTDKQIRDTIPKHYRFYYPGKEIARGFMSNWGFYIREGMSYNLLTGKIEHED